MGSAFVITVREGLEAALIIGILATYLGRMGDRALLRPLWLGVLTALAASLLMAAIVLATYGQMTGRGEELFEGAATALAAAILTYMIFWMRRQGPRVRMELEARAQAAMRTGSALAIAALGFTAVFREGAETVLFLTAAREGTSLWAWGSGAFAGLALAAGTGFGVFQLGLRISVRTLFNATSAVLFVVAAGLVVKATGAFQVVGLLPGTISVWDTSRFLSEAQGLGSVLHSLMGYVAAPSLLQLILWLSYLALVGYLYLGVGQRATPADVAVPFRPLGTDYADPLYRLLRSRWPSLALPTMMGLALAALIVVGLFAVDVGPFDNQGGLRIGPFANTENSNNLFNFAIWVIWLPLLSISAAMAGRLWCGNLCPLRLVTDLGRSLGDRLTGRGHPPAPYLRAGWVPLANFILITFVALTVSVQSQAAYGAYLFLGILVLAFSVGLLLRRGAWCRYFCPVGGWLSRIARLSVLGLRPNSQVCATCSDKPCLRGTAQAGPCPTFLNPSRLDSSRYCLTCWQCVKNCPQEKASLRLGLRPPAMEVLVPSTPDMWESLYIMALLGMYVAVGHRWVALTAVPWPLLFFGLMGLAAAFFLGLCAIIAALKAMPFRQAVTTLGYIFLPLEFAAAILTFGDDALEFFGITVGAAEVLLTLGFVGSVVLAASVLRHQCRDGRRAALAAVPVGVALLALLALWLNWYASGTVVDLT